MKCLPVIKIASAHGKILHDWHAEVLAIRALNHFILQECRAVLAAEDDAHPYCSPYIQRRAQDDAHVDGNGVEQQPFVWRQDVTLHMYCSEAPCGDASMELTMSAQQDASPWESPLPPHMMNRITASSSSSTPSPTTETTAAAATAATPDLLLLGRACFSHLGVVRRKPARPDAPPTLSKSCSDKLAMHQCTSLLSSVVSRLVSPSGVYLHSVILPESQYSATGCERCFSAKGRMAPLADLPKGEDKGEGDGYAFRPFAVETTPLEFEFSKRGGDGARDTKYVASALSTAWSANGLAENIIGGVLQGRKQTDARGASQVSREKMWHLAGTVAELVASSGNGDNAVAVPTAMTYRALKESEAMQSRRRIKGRAIKDALTGWVRNIGDDEFHLSNCGV